MGYSITFHGAGDQHGEAETFFLCSLGAWTQFGEWAEALPNELDAPKKMFVSGEFVGTDRLATQLASAIEDHPPILGVLTTIDAMLEVMGVGDPDETATLTD